MKKWNNALYVYFTISKESRENIEYLITILQKKKLEAETGVALKLDPPFILKRLI